MTRFDEQRERKVIDEALAPLKGWLLEQARISHDVDGDDLPAHDARDVRTLLLDLAQFDRRTLADALWPDTRMGSKTLAELGW